MDKHLKIIEFAFTQHELKTRQKTKENFLEPLYRIIDSTESLEGLAKQLEEIANNLITLHSIVLTDVLEKKIIDLISNTIEKRMLN